MATADAMAKGQLDVPCTLAGQDEMAAIGRSFEQVRVNVNQLNAEMNRMAHAHEAGDIDVVVDSQRFEGEFRTVAQGVNDMVGAHIAVKKLAMGVLKQFGEGNFDAPMDKLPGKKAFINETIETVRGNLKGLIAQMNQMAVAHEAGDIDVVNRRPALSRATSAPWPQGVNDMVNAHIAVKKMAMGCDQAVRRRQLQRADGQAAGQEGLHQRHHRAGAHQPQGSDRADEPDGRRARRR